MIETLPPQQLSLGVSLNDDATFGNFYTVAGSNNQQVLTALWHLARGEGDEAFIYIWGAGGVGLTHLLQAACHEAAGRGLAVQYLPLRDLLGFAPEPLLEGFETLDLICIDDLDLVAGSREWELALFCLFNSVRDNGGRLLTAALCSPHHLPVQLPDLRSRLAWGVVYQVDSMTDADKQKALQSRARARGLELSAEVAQYILHRAPRDMNELFFCLNRLDDASLAEQRRLTIPFVKRVLGL